MSIVCMIYRSEPRTLLVDVISKYGSRSIVMASANLWNSLRGERTAWLKNSLTVESFKSENVSSVNGS